MSSSSTTSPPPSSSPTVIIFLHLTFLRFSRCFCAIGATRFETFVPDGEKLTTRCCFATGGASSKLRLWSMVARHQATVVVAPGTPISVLSTIFLGATLVLLDDQMRIARVRQVGRIHVGGRQLFSVYAREPEAMAQAFVRPPFAQEATLYATGT